MNLINVKDLIVELKNRNIDLGKGNPYNRLRYYTKIGWIDHMVRKKDATGVVNGHFPIGVIDQIVLIENLKKEEKSNEEISSILKEKKNNSNKKELPTEEFKKLFSKITVTHVLLFLIIVGLIFELTNNNSRNDKLINSITNSNLQPSLNRIVETGFNFIPSGTDKIYINSKNVNKNSIIVINFESNINPATSYFISEKIENEGFFIKTNLPVNTDSKFSWIVIN